MHPATFRIIRLLIHSLILPFAMKSSHFAQNFISVINDYVEKPLNKDDLVNMIHLHIQNDLDILSRYHGISEFQGMIYYHETLNSITGNDLQNCDLKKEEYKKATSRNSFEDLFSKVFKEKSEDIIKNIRIQDEKCPILQKLKFREDQINLFGLEKKEMQQVIKLLDNENSEHQGIEYKTVKFILDNSEDLDLLVLCEGFIKFASVVTNKLNGRITREKAKQMTIQEFLSEENNNQIKIDNIHSLFNQFKDFWRLCFPKVKYLLELYGIKEEKIPKEINEENYVDIILVGNDQSNMAIPIFIHHLLNIHNNLVKSETFRLFFQKNSVDQSFYQGSYPLVFPLKKTNDFESTKILKFDFKEFQDFVNNQLVDNLDTIYQYICAKLRYFSQSTILLFEIENFVYFNEESKIQVDFLQDPKWKQEFIPNSEWETIKDELIQNHLFDFFKMMIKNVVLICRNISLNEQNMFLIDLSILKFLNSKLDCSYFNQIGEFCPEFKENIKLKHLLFLFQKNLI
ncbi:hypothetical protein M0811_02316 [Anaeramoeba ignava]|uniref:Uncharacterized protein n=1 Tax=Anaeramoeba ignava TaxID=1746090 RepID=A0A9Q0LCB8_ANAIG|nr:hypothetical protein M0811_02316 [Anaeramoeba ignava]